MLTIGAAGAKADDVVVTTETTWDFSNLTYDSETAANNYITVVTADTKSETKTGLYYRAGAYTEANGKTDKQARSIRIAQSGQTKTYTFDDGTALKATKNASVVVLPGNSNINLPSSLTASNKEGSALTSDDNSNYGTLAFTTSKPGVVYVFFQGGSNPASGKTNTYSIWFKGNSESNYSQVATFVSDDSKENKGFDDNVRSAHITYAANEAGTFFIGSKEQSMVIYAVKFVPFGTSATTPIPATAANYDGGFQVNAMGIIMTMGTQAAGEAQFHRVNNTLETGEVLKSEFGNYVSACTQSESKWSSVAPLKDAARCNTSNKVFPDRGTYYTFAPQYSGKLKIACLFCGKKTTYFVADKGDGTWSDDVQTYYATTSSNDLKQYTFNVVKGKTYYFWTDNTGDLRFYGFTFTPQSNAETVTATVTAAGDNYATFANLSGSNLEVPEGLTAYAAYIKDGASQVTLSPIGSVIPAGAGVILQGESAGDYNLTLTDADATYTGTNELVTTTGHISLAQTSGTKTNYIFTKNGGTLGFFKVQSAGGAIDGGKAYLSTANAASARSYMDFALGSDDATGIDHATTASIDGDTQSEAMYTLQGQRVSSPRRGLYVVNGKKMVIR